MIILGIDPGTRITGYGIINLENGKRIENVIDYGCIRPSPNMKLTERYYILYGGVLELIQKHQPHVLAVESQYMHKNPQSALKLGMARGAIIVAAKQHSLPVFEYTPSKAKVAIVGNGRASKEQMQSMIQKLLRLSTLPQPEDAADALALALCHAYACQSPVNLTNEV